MSVGFQNVLVSRWPCDKKSGDLEMIKSKNCMCEVLLVCVRRVLGSMELAVARKPWNASGSLGNA